MTSTIQGYIRELYNYQKRLSIALRAAGICVFEVDIEAQRYTFFENSEAIFGVTGEKIMADVEAYSQLSSADYRKGITEYFVHPDDGEIVQAAFASILKGQSTSYEARMRAGSSKYVWCKVELTVTKGEDGRSKMLGVIFGIESMKNTIIGLRMEAQLDPFTRLYNKTRFEELSQQILRESDYAALLIIDLDHFKQVNDTYGHQAGDRVLLEISAELRKEFRANAVVGRFGGDEFVVLLKNADAAMLVENKVRRFLQADDNYLHVTKSIGVAMYPAHGKDYPELLASADQALYKAKESRNTYAFAD